MTTIQMRRGTAAEWTAANPVLAAGEPGFEKDTNKLKIGDGVTTWSLLPYFVNESALVPNVQTINAQTGTTFTPALTDSGKLVSLSNTSGITVTLPQDSAVPFPVGSRIDFVSLNTGLVTFTNGSGATVNGTPSLVLRAQWSSATAIKRAANTWVVVGDLT